MKFIVFHNLDMIFDQVKSPIGSNKKINILFYLDYKSLSMFKRQFPNVSILGLTATATIKVIDDVRQILGIPRCILFRAPFNRKNLFYEVLHKSDVGKDAFNELVHCIQHRFDKQSGIVYCLSQKDAEDVCCELQRSCKYEIYWRNSIRKFNSYFRHQSWLLSCWSFRSRSYSSS